MTAISLDPRFPPPRRIVAKVGSSSLHVPGGGVDVEVIGDLCAQIAALRAGGTEVVLVSSGAVAAGVGHLGWVRRPTELRRLQAAASVGQGVLVHTYQAAFTGHGLASGQVLLTPQDLVDRSRYLNARATLETLLEVGAVPIVNENDAVATDELRVGDNDRLAALVASMVNADLLVLLSDVEGLYADVPADTTGDAPPDAQVIERVDDVATVDRRTLGGAASAVGTGGMVTKLDAARIATFSAAHCVIARTRRPGSLRAAVAGEHVGTWFPPAARRPESRKLWIAFAPQPKGALHIDDGAVAALTQRGSSLLAAGIIEVVGDFGADDAVDVVAPDGRVVARGLVAYAAADVAGLRGLSTARIAEARGADFERAVIHRDRLVVLA